MIPSHPHTSDKAYSVHAVYGVDHLAVFSVQGGPLISRHRLFSVVRFPGVGVTLTPSMFPVRMKSLLR